jgi:hypothetical protein
MIPPTIERWEHVVKSRDLDLLDQLLADDVVFESPVVHTPQVGRAITRAYLSAALQVLNSPEFRYIRRWLGEQSAVLEFETRLAGLTINGVDIINLEFRRPNQPLQGDDPTAEGDQRRAPGDGPAARRQRPKELRARRRPFRECPLLAQSGHGLVHRTCPLSGVKRTYCVVTLDHGPMVLKRRINQAEMSSPFAQREGD